MFTPFPPVQSWMIMGTEPLTIIIFSSLAAIKNSHFYQQVGPIKSPSGQAWRHGQIEALHAVEKKREREGRGKGEREAIGWRGVERRGVIGGVVTSRCEAHSFCPTQITRVGVTHVLKLNFPRV